jgi:hypothetical protein
VNASWPPWNIANPTACRVNYYGTAETDRKLIDHLHLHDREALLCHLGTDLRYVGPRYVGPSSFSGLHGYHSSGTDRWGMQWKAVPNPFTTYYERIDHPLAHAKNVKDIESYAWPSIDWMAVDHIPEAITQINHDERRAVVFAASTSGRTHTDPDRDQIAQGADHCASDS